MASTRPTRGRRQPSPHDTPTVPRTSVKNEGPPEQASNFGIEGWSEPAPRILVASFEDHKGLERHGVLEHMAPLGQLPGQRLKAKMKAQDPLLRRPPPIKGGDVRTGKDEIHAERSPTNTTSHTRRAEPKHKDNPSARPHREKDTDGDFRPKTSKSSAPAKSPGVAPSTNGATANSLVIPRGKLGDVVNAAAKRANEVGNPGLGRALTRLYEESKTSQPMADLLDAVLSQKVSQAQSKEFQRFVRHARKRHEMGIEAPKIDTPKSAAFTTRASDAGGARHMGGPDEAPHAPAQKIFPSTTGHRTSAKHHAPVNGSSMRDERPAKRLKRTNSKSSESSLSSLSTHPEDSISENGVVEAVNGNASPSRANNVVAKASTGPRLGSFSTSRQEAAQSRPEPDNATDILDAKKRKSLHAQNFDGYKVSDSNVRPTLRNHVPVHDTPPRIETPKARHPPSRLRNGATQRSKRYNEDDDDDLSSPPSSPGDLLVPPPYGALRDSTPNQLNRPPRLGQKSARIKTSPIKKGGKATTAGVKPPVDPKNTVGDRRENEDFCAACSGNGTLICCEGCTRSFHYTCVDPPVDAEDLPEEWFCIVCRPGAVDKPSGKARSFEGLRTNLKRKNPFAYNLPHDIRSFYEHVKTGEEGEFEADRPGRPNRTRIVTEDNPTAKQKDGTQKAVLCYRCGGSALGSQKELISCDVCGEHWHFDCLDPPMASITARQPTREARPWTCPMHEGPEVTIPPAKKLKLESTNENSKSRRAARSYKIRKPKYPTVKDNTLARGSKNNGTIEVATDEESNTESEVEREIAGTIYRIPAKEIKLNFIDAVHKMRQRERIENAEAIAKISKTKFTKSGELFHPAPAKEVAPEAAGDFCPILDLRAASEMDAARILLNISSEAVVNPTNEAVVNPTNETAGKLNQMATPTNPSEFLAFMSSTLPECGPQIQDLFALAPHEVMMAIAAEILADDAGKEEVTQDSASKEKEVVEVSGPNGTTEVTSTTEVAKTVETGAKEAEKEKPAPVDATPKETDVTKDAEPGSTTEVSKPTEVTVVTPTQGKETEKVPTTTTVEVITTTVETVTGEPAIVTVVKEPELPATGDVPTEVVATTKVVETIAVETPQPVADKGKEKAKEAEPTSTTTTHPAPTHTPNLKKQTLRFIGALIARHLNGDF